MALILSCYPPAMRFLLPLILLGLCACSPKPGAGSAADSQLTLADIYKAASATTEESQCVPEGHACAFFMQITPDVLASRLNLAPLTKEGADTVGIAGKYRLEMQPSSLDYWGVNMYVPNP